ncbi:hypothetical protein DIPPA_30256 [Diplonema papillatum]|nr:hypothetical protein DIPPA_30256 [Diplonema papillatum]
MLCTSRALVLLAGLQQLAYLTAGLDLPPVSLSDDGWSFSGSCTTEGSCSGTLTLDDEAFTATAQRAVGVPAAGMATWTVTADASAFTVSGLTMQNVGLHVEFVVNSTSTGSAGMTLGSATVSGTLRMFGVEATGTAIWENGEFKLLVVSVSLDYAAAKVDLEISYVNESCSPTNFGAAGLRVPSLGLDIEGWISQTTHCDWELEFETAGASVDGFELPAVTVAVDHLSASEANAATAHYVVTLTGALAVGGNDLEAIVVFDTQNGLESFTAGGSIDMPPVTGSVNVSSVAGERRLSGEGSLVLDLDVVEIEAAATLSYDGATDELRVAVTAESVEMFGIELQRTLVDVTRTRKVEDGASGDGNGTSTIHRQWDGALSSVVNAGPAMVIVSGKIRDGKLSHLLGMMQLTYDTFSADVAMVINQNEGVATCPHVSGNGTVTFSSPAALFDVSAVYDHCASQVGDERFVLLGSNTKEFTVFGIDVESAALHLAEVVTESSDQGVVKATAWEGNMSADVTFYQLSGSALIVIEDSDVSKVNIEVELLTSFLKMEGVVAVVSGGCSEENGGTAELELLEQELSLTGVVAQKMGSTGSCVWALSAKTKESFSLGGVTVESATFNLEKSGSEWEGDASAALRIGTSWLEGTIAFSSGFGVTSFSGTGQIDLDIGSLVVEAQFAEGMMVAEATLSALSVGAAEFPGCTGTVQHVLDASTAAAAGEPWWLVDVKSSGALRLFGFELRDVHVAMAGEKAIVSKVETLLWSGVAGGTVALGELEMTVEAVLENSAFTSMEGTLSFATSGLSLTAEATVTSDNNQSCGFVEASGELEFTPLKVGLSVDFSYDACASAVGDEVYALSGEMRDAVDIVHGLKLTEAALALKGLVAGGKNKTMWGGSLVGAVSLFGATARGELTWAEGKLTGLEVATSFMTGNGVLRGSLKLDYGVGGSGGCFAVTGAGTFVVTIPGADDLAFAATLEYDTCTGKLEVSGGLASWKAPGAEVVSGVGITLSTKIDAKTETLSSRNWTVTVAGVVGSVEFMLTLNTANASHIGFLLAREDANTVVRLLLNTGDCTGSGFVALKSLPGNLPALEMEVAVLQSNCKDSWTVEGRVENVAVRVGGKIVQLLAPMVRVQRFSNGRMEVSLGGEWGAFQLMLSFDLPNTRGVSLSGTLARTKATATDVVKSLMGSSPLGASTGQAVSSLASKVIGVELLSGRIEFQFGSAPRMEVSATVSVFEGEFSVDIVAAKSAAAGVWSCAVLVRASNLGSVRVHAAVDKVVNEMAPDYISLSVATGKMTTGSGVVVEKGLVFAAGLASDSAVMSGVSKKSPAGFRTAITAGASSVGYVAKVKLVSLSEFTVLIGLTANIPLWAKSPLVVRELAVAFALSPTQVEIGFMLSMDVKIGGRTLTCAGLVALSSASDFSIELSAESDPPTWNDAFGLKGLSITTPLGISFGLNLATMVPSSFGILGAVSVGSVSGSVLLSLDVTNPLDMVFKGELTGLSMRALVRDLLKCSACTSGAVGTVLTTFEIGYLGVSVNPNPALPAVIRFAGVTETVAPGIRVHVKNLNFWNVIQIDEALFAASSNGIEAYLSAKPVNLGGLITITSAESASRGPLLALELTTSKQRVFVSGRATVLGRGVSLEVDWSGTSVSARFSMNVLVSINCAISFQGVPGSSSFQGTVTAEFPDGFIQSIVNNLVGVWTAALDKATSALRKAQSDVTKAQRDVDDATRAATNDLNKAIATLNNAQRECDNLDASFRRARDNCHWTRPWFCVEAGALKTAWAGCIAGLEIAKGAVAAARAAVDGAGAVAKLTLEGAKGVLKGAEALSNGFAKVLKAAGNLVSSLADITYLKFRVGLSSSNVRAYVRVKAHFFKQYYINSEFSVYLSFTGIKDFIVNSFKSKAVDFSGQKLFG